MSLDFRIFVLILKQKVSDSCLSKEISDFPSRFNLLTFKFVVMLRRLLCKSLRTGRVVENLSALINKIVQLARRNDVTLVEHYAIE
jgi:hypothetical protein